GDRAGCGFQTIEQSIEVAEQREREIAKRGRSPANRTERRRDRSERVAVLLAVLLELLDVLLRELPRERLPSQRFELLPCLRTEVLVLELSLDPHEAVRVGQLRDESLRMLRE